MAAATARLLHPGDIVFLSGPLGAGKTCFIRAAARELGVTEPVTSPSFTMAQTYSGRLPVHHLDLYRLRRFDPEDAVDFEPFFAPDAITFIEWPERAAPFIETPALVIKLEHIDETSRRLVFEAGREAHFDPEEIIASTGP